ncbi:SDR family oxidoreductase [Nonomuraea sp. NPDC050783]|uniref:SDR family oxidoreductase n=1 Tax=Nonomuraea sp. NPDC050783 TaxID=3154634 RepID=UPI003467ACBD
MTAPLEGRTAIVTGASRGIGLAAAAGLHAAGANVVLTARTREAAEAAASTVGERALGIGAHATDQTRARACVDRTMETFGSVDILVNNAGTNPAYGRVLSQDHARFAKTFDVNLWAPVMWSQLVVEAWMQANGGSIINTASISGLAPDPDLGLYGASKAALIFLTQQLAAELGPGIRVNAIAPGVVRTRLAELLWKDHEPEVAGRIPLKRIGEPEDVAAAIVFLAAPSSSWITGETLVIDGGQRLGATIPDVTAADFRAGDSAGDRT